MRKDEAKAMVLDLITADLQAAPFPIELDPTSPDPRDPCKFVLGGRVACPIHHFSGWHPKIDLNWFQGGFEEPQVHGFPFYWYVFAIPGRHGQRRDHYLICDFLQVREWVLDFAAPLGRDYRDNHTWRADLHVYGDGGLERQGYFRWGDEPTTLDPLPDRVFELDNVGTVHDLQLIRERVGTFGLGGESAAHRRLKLYVASHPTEFGLSARALPHVEYRFQTGDRVDVMFENHLPDRTVIEVEVAGEQNVCVGIHQAIKYRSLAEADAGYPLMGSRVRSLVVAYDTAYQQAVELADRYDVVLASVDSEKVLSVAS